MKKLAIVLMLALPAVAFGATGSAAMSSGGLTTIEMTPAGGVFMMDVTVAADAAFSTLGAQLNASADNVFSVQDTGWTFGLALTTPTFFDANRFLPPEDGGDLALPVLLGTQAFYDGILLYPDLGFQKNSGSFLVTTWPKVVWSIPITVAAGLPVGSSYDLLFATKDFVTATGGGLESTATGMTVKITPEPATMLLLAVALPFLRRRSA